MRTKKLDVVNNQGQVVGSFLVRKTAVRLKSPHPDHKNGIELSAFPEFALFSIQHMAEVNASDDGIAVIRSYGPKLS